MSTGLNRPTADICGAVRAVLEKNPPARAVDDSFLKRYIGHHLIDLFNDLFPGMPPDGIDRLVCEYRAVYPARDHRATHVYPGVIEALSALGGRKSTATTKGTPTTRLVLERFGLLRFFDHVQGTDGFPCKPAPDVVLKSLDVFGVRPEDCLLVGDSAPDMEAGRRAGVKTCAVTWGYGDLDAMRLLQPDFWIDDLRELLPALVTRHSSALNPYETRDLSCRRGRDE
ncbi:MAG: HAD-IA family hydrolase [Acidobacteria bacterium]|nr:HAD-IA family hydrolase [Acidobacteriota bacterium]